MEEYRMNVNEVYESTKSAKDGLNEKEAKRRLISGGYNILKEEKRKSAAQMFAKQLSDPMTLVLAAAALISAVLSAVEREFPSDVIIIMTVVIINSVLGVVQEGKAEKALEALKKLTEPEATVVRSGRIQTVPAKELVVGDVITVEAGNSIPADARIVECVKLRTEESALTGESLPVEKTDKALTNYAAIPSDRKNMIFMGSTAVYGHAKAVVTQTGMNTEMGKIADALNSCAQEETPLQKKLSGLSKILTYTVIAICVLVFIINISRNLICAGELEVGSALDTFMIAVSLAVAAVPEGLAAVVTIVLSIGVTNMSKRNAVIRKLTAVETLGCTGVICTDKTGTLTQNRMSVAECFASDKKLFLEAVTLCSDAQISEKGKKLKGDPTETALVRFALSEKTDVVRLKESYKRVGEIPFESSRKMMTTLYISPEGKNIQYTKGAPGEILKRCTSYVENSGIYPMNDKMRKKILEVSENMADKALRVLAAAQKTYVKLPKDCTSEILEKDMCFVGLAGMTDPLRAEAKFAVNECKNAGIRTVMITGDHRDTAAAVAEKLGIIKNRNEVITGEELDRISDADFEPEKYAVYARVRPEHKTRIVKAWKRNGTVTAMTGDGINDAPSIKSADIGIGMGKNGTDVTKNVSDMILADDNFATIVYAVGEGRRIYDNIRKAVQFMLASNLSEVLSIFAATVMGFDLFKPVHLLWINLITDCLPALSLGMEKAENDIMQRNPRNKNDGLFAGGMGFAVAYQGILVTLITLASYFIGKEFLYPARADSLKLMGYSPENLGTTMAFFTLSMAEIFHAFNMRSLHGSVLHMGHRNYYLWGAGILSLILTTYVIEIPFLADSFSLVKLCLHEYAVSLGLAFTIVPTVEAAKLCARRIRKRKNT